VTSTDTTAPNLPPHWITARPDVVPGATVIFDIDGVLADAAGRQHYLEYGNWRAFFDACGDDPVIEEIECLLELLDAALRIVLVTGRPRRVADATVGWLTRYGLRWDVLVMRDFGDYDDVDQFKRGVVADLREAGFTLRLALDDDPKNHAMYVSEGVPCIYIHSGYYL
jgi:phosphoglycolate phosphatase-like HAD superfamily hydrolase